MNKKRITSLMCAVVLLITTATTGFVASAVTNIYQPSKLTTTYDFDDKVQRLWGRNGYVDDPIAGDNIRMNVPAYSVSHFRFGYELKANKTYKLAYDYKASSAARTTPFNFITQPASIDYTVFEEGGANFRKDHLLFDAPVTVSPNWQRVETTFTTTDAMLAGGNKYIAFGFKTIWDPVEFLMDNISITEMPTGLGSISVSDFEIGDTPVYHALGGMDYKTENGNRFFNLSGTSAYQQFPFRTKHELKPNTKYEISFKFKNNSNGGLNQGLYLMAGNSVNDWNFYTTGDNPKEKNILGTAPNTNAGIDISNSNTDWTERKIVVDTATTKAVDNTFKYLSFYCQTAEGSKFDISFDDLVVTEISDTYETLGFVVLNDNKGSELTYASDTVGATVQIPNPTSTTDEFYSWYTDKALNNKFDGVMAKGSTMLYAKYNTTTIDFNDINKTYIYNAQNAVVKDGAISMPIGAESYATLYFRLDYQMKPNKTYQISFDYKNSNDNFAPHPTFLSQSKTFLDTDFHGESQDFKKYKLFQMSNAIKNTWTPAVCTFTTTAESVTDARNYLSFGFKKQWGAGEFNIDNIKIKEMDAPVASTLGAQIRTNGIQGLRFVNEFNYNVEAGTVVVAGKTYTVNGYGTLMVPTHVSGAEILNKENPKVLDVPAKVDMEKSATGKKYTAVLINIPVKNYKTDIQTRAYVDCTDSSGQKVTFYGVVITKNIYNVAKTILADPGIASNPDLKANLEKIVRDADAA